MSGFEDIYHIIQSIPAGHVASYGQVAAAMGKPRGARLVGWALGALPRPHEVPWQRVINKQRRLSIVNPKVSAEVQKELLEQEGRTLERKEDGWYVTGTDWYNFSSEKKLL